MSRRNYGAKAYKMLIQMGFSVPYVVCVPKTQDINASPCLEDLARGYGTRILYDLDVVSINNGSASNIVEDVDVVVSYQYWKRVKGFFLSSPKLGSINFHPAPLPEYRGWRPHVHAILQDAQSWGVTAHYMDNNFDTGNIIQVKRFDVNCKYETAFSLSLKHERFRLEQFCEVMTQLQKEGGLPSLPQKEGKYYTEKDYESGKYVNLDTISSEDLDRRIRAYFHPPREGAYTLDKKGNKILLTNQFVIDQLGLLDSISGAI